mgnify:CR=1 FL=1
MSLQDKVMEQLKNAMRSKDAVALQSLRAIKAALLLAQTDAGATGELSETEELKLLQKLVKQRKDSAALYKDQGREDLAQPELDQVAVIEQFLPQQLTAIYNLLQSGPVLLILMTMLPSVKTYELMEQYIQMELLILVL